MTMKVWNNGERVNHADLNLNFYAPKSGTQGWLEAIIAATESNGTSVCLSPGGGAAYVAGTRTSDSTQVGAMGSFAIGAFAINNNATQVQVGYGAYIEARRYAGAGATEAIETCIVNFGDSKTVRPDTGPATGQTFNLLLGAGRPDVNSNNNSIAIGIGGSTRPDGGRTRHNSGIMFFGNSVEPTGNSGYAYPIAIDMPWTYGLTFRNAQNGNVGAFLRSNLITNGQLAGIEFQDGGLRLISGDGQDRIVINNGALALNGLVTATTAIVIGAMTVGTTFGVTGTITSVGKILAQGGIRLSGIVTAANDTAAGAAGAISGDIYNNTTVGALAVKV